MARLILYLNGLEFQRMDIELPSYEWTSDDREADFEYNCQVREQYVKSKVEEMKLLYCKQIIHCKNNYAVVFEIESQRAEDSIDLLK